MTVVDPDLGTKVGFEVLAVDDPKRAFEWLFIGWLAVVTEESAHEPLLMLLTLFPVVSGRHPFPCAVGANK
jgi:hypothetical protein